jgi:hypothetical protein
LLGAAFAAIASLDRDTVVIALLIALGCYLAAAALQMRWVAWASIPIGSALVVGGALVGIEPWVVLGGASVVLVLLGLALRASRPVLAAQSLALIGYGGVGLVALALGPIVGAVIASIALMAHAIWDVIHFRRNAVVPRSLSEACMFFDVPLGLALLILVLTGSS